MSRGPLIAVVGLVLRLLAAPDPATAQVFIASQPAPDFTIGPLFVRANVGPAAGPVDVTVLFSVVAPSTKKGDAGAQDIYLLWPGEVDGESVAGAPDPELRRAKQATWLENFLWGERHMITLSFNDVRTRAAFPMYLAHRDRWDVEHHEVEIELDGDRVRDVRAQVHRSRLTQPGPA